MESTNTKEHWFKKSFATLDALGPEEDIPYVVVQNAKCLLKALLAAGIEPTRIVDTYERTIAIWVQYNNQKLRIEAFAKEEFLVSNLTSSTQPTHEVYRTAREVYDFLIGAT